MRWWGIGRRIRQEPGFHLAVVGCLAAGIGMSTAVFTVTDAVLLAPLAYEDPDELVALQATLRGPDGELQKYFVSPANLVEMRERSRTLEAIDAVWPESYDLTGMGDPTRLTGGRATPGLFETLGVDPLLGRTFRPEDVDRPAVVISEGVWERILGRRPDVVGTTLRIGGTAREVIGVVPEETAYPPGGEVWTPYRPADAPESERHSGGLQAVGRLAGGVRAEDARREMDRIAADLEALFPAHNGGRGIDVAALRAPFVEDSRTALAALTASVVLFLLATVANVAGLFAVRAGRRSRLLAIRVAIGAPRSRIVGGALLEGLAIASAATVLALGVAWLVVPYLTRSLQLLPPGADPTVVDGRILLFVVAALSATALACSAVPALMATRTDGVSALTDGARGSTPSGSERRLQRAAVLGQALLGVVLVLAAAASVDHLGRLLRIDPGFGGAPALTVRVPVSDERFPTFGERADLVLRLQRSLLEIPGVTAAGGTDVLPVGDPNVGYSLSVEDHPPDDPSAFEVAQGRLVTPGYLAAAGIPILRGRDVAPSDRLESAPVVLVSEAFAELYWPDEDAIGKRVKRRTWDSPFPWMEVVGVVADVRDGGPTSEIGPTWYLPYAQHDTRLGREMSFVVRSSRPTEELLAEVRRRLGEIDPLAPVIRARPLEELQAEALSAQWTASRVLAAFALGGLLLVVMGTYGVVARAVLERRAELGLRRALGAGRAQVVVEVLRTTGFLVTSGLVLGLLLSPLVVEWSSRIVGSTLAVPSWGYPVAGGLVLAAGLLASLVPALRAARISPIESLRSR